MLWDIWSIPDTQVRNENCLERKRYGLIVTSFYLAVKYGLDGGFDKYVYMRGGPLPEGKKFHLVQFHLHWGNATHGGSEHLLEGERYFIRSDARSSRKNTDREIV